MTRVRMQRMEQEDLQEDLQEDQEDLQVDLQVDLVPRGGLKELVLSWFNETQAPLMLHNGNFPDWFKGFCVRKDTEDLLRDKAPGCFLIRLSDKALGFILSYKGQDRCRHFVITQNEDGHFVLSGDRRTHRSLPELIQHYRASPIQPFGEHLTCSWLEVNTGELYDVVNYKAIGKSGLSVQALRTLWDQKHSPHGDAGNNLKVQRQSTAPAVHPPALPPKSKSRKLKGTVSVDTMSLVQGVPPVPKGGLLLGVLLSGSLPDTTSQTGSDPSGSEGVRGNTNPALTFDRNRFHTSYPEIRSTSLPMLSHSHVEEEEEDEEDQGSCPSFSTSSLQRTTCLTYSLHEPRDGPRPSGSSDQRAGEASRSNPLYQTSPGSGEGSNAQQENVTYSEVPRRPDDTYEQIPGHMYESLEDMKTMRPQSTWGKNYVKWKKFLPDSKKKK